ncbi:apoptosis-inducing factor 3 (plasmid) [Pararobbsia alpina]|uniref:FAD-dependent oxidoreductase n=1 Tax=Pararobbsia alpina TaxID=621374 RepID=UPI0039A610B2
MSDTQTPTARMQDLSEGEIKRIERASGVIVLARDGGRVFALSATCPHAGAPLDEGAICHGRLVCPWHKATFDLATGALLEPPALEGLQHFAVRVEGDDIHVAEVAEKAARVPSDVSGAADHRVFAVVGAGAAGAAACATLREHGFSGRILLIDVETTQPYDRTALSKFVPSGELKPEDVYPLLPDGFLVTHSIEVINSRVASLNAASRKIETTDGETLQYDAALVATGGAPVHPDIAGLTDERVAQRVVFLRSLVDAHELDALAQTCKRALVIGGSFIGLETASALRKRGIDVTVVMPQALPFERQFGGDVARRLKRLHEASGTRFRSESAVTSIEWRDGTLLAHLKEAEAIECDFVLVGTGVRPATAFLKGVERNQDGGVNVNGSMRVKGGDDTLYAAGDIAFVSVHGGEGMRIEHWRVAQQQGRIAALNMAGIPTSPRIVPFFWTFHCERRFDYIGHAQSGDWTETRTIGSLEELGFITLYLRDDHVLAALGCNKESKMAWLAERMREPLAVNEALREVG